MNNQIPGLDPPNDSANPVIVAGKKCWSCVTEVADTFAFFLCCCLHIVKEDCFDPLQGDYENYKRRKSAQKRPMNPKCHHLPRKRKLTIEPASAYASQASCLLLKLPWEIRSVIYHQVLGGRRVHFDMVDKNFFKSHGPVCYFCREGRTPRFGPAHEHCEEHWFDRKTVEHFSKKMIQSENVLCLLQTCRQIYSEAVDILYATTIMQPCSIESLLCLQKIMLPQRLQMIQSLEVQMQPDIFIPKDTRLIQDPPITMEKIEYNSVNHEEFKKAWDLLAKMPNLRLLRVDLFLAIYARGWWDFIQPTLEETISRVSTPETFEVYLYHPMFIRSDPVHWGSAKILGLQEFEERYALTRNTSGIPPARPSNGLRNHSTVG